MAFALDVANVGNNTGDGGGASPDITFNTAATVAAGARIFVVASIDAAGNADTIDTCSGGGLTWTKLGGGEDGASSEAVAVFYADAPSGLASGTTITVAITGNFFGWQLAASSYTALGWSQSGATNVVSITTGTAWASGNMTVPTGGGLVIAGNGGRSLAGAALTSTPTSPSVEDQDRSSITGNGAIIERRIEASGGTVTVAGTYNVTVDGATTVTAVFVEPALGGKAYSGRLPVAELMPGTPSFQPETIFPQAQGGPDLVQPLAQSRYANPLSLAGLLGRLPFQAPYYPPAASGQISAAVGQATETDVALAITARKSRLLGQALETDTGQAITARKSRLLAIASETDAAQALGSRKVKLLGIASETDTALNVVSKQFSKALETDTALPIGRVKSRAIGTASETDSARMIFPVLRKALETDFAFSLGRLKSRLLGTVAETDAAQPIGRRKVKAIGTATELDEALPITASGGAVQLSNTYKTRTGHGL